jgi:hypothetical protein
MVNGHHILRRVKGWQCQSLDMIQETDIDVASHVITFILICTKRHAMHVRECETRVVLPALRKLLLPKYLRPTRPLGVARRIHVK